MKVIALDTGFWNGSRVRKGEEFEVNDDAKAPWFAPVGEVAAAKAIKAVKAEKAKQTTNTPTALSQVGKEAAKSFNDVMDKKADDIA